MYITILLFGVIGFLKSSLKYLLFNLAIIIGMIFLDQHPQYTTIKLFGIESTRMVNLYVFFMMGSLLYIFTSTIIILFLGLASFFLTRSRILQ